MTTDSTADARGGAHTMILGCGRSGTSIFGELFSGLADYRYRSEPSFDELLDSDFRSPQAVKVPRESEAYPAKPGLSFPLDAFLTKAPGAKIFWIVRHPLDAICSLRVGIDRDWGHHPRPPDWRDWLDRPLLERCAYHWAFLNTAGFAQVEDRAILVHYEEMLTDPLGFARGVSTAVDIDPSAVAAQLRTWAARVQNTNNDAFIEAETSRNYSRPDHTIRVGRWRENLSDADVRSLWPMVAETAARFGYTLSG